MSIKNGPIQDPLTQTLKLFGPHGSNTTLSLNDLESAMFPRLVNCTAYTSHIALCTGVLFILLITTPRDRLKKPVQILNILSLIGSILYSAMQYTSLTSSAFQIEVQIFSDNKVISRAEKSLASILPLVGSLVVGFIEFSFVLQCRSVFASYKSTKKWMTLATVSVAIAVTSWCVALDIHQIIIIRRRTPRFIGLYNTKHIAFAFSICFFSSIFVTKLWSSIHTQRKLGFRQFGPLQVIFIMACQSMILPLIFCVVGTCYPYRYAVSHTGRIMVVINLPLSSVWAAARVNMATDDNISSLFPSVFQPMDPGLSNSPSSRSGNTIEDPDNGAPPRFDESKNMDLTIGTYLANKGYNKTNAL